MTRSRTPPENRAPPLQASPSEGLPLSADASIPVENPSSTRQAGLWHHRDFRRLWLGQGVSEFGSRITREGLPMMAILTLNASTTQMGLLMAAGSAGTLLVGLVAGVWVDRLRRRPIMIAADLGRAALLLSIPLAALLGRLGMVQIYIVSFLAGVLTVFFEVANRSILPSLVGRDRVVEGNSKLGMTSSMAEVLGPPLTGGLVQLVTAPVAILLDALSFVWSAVCIGLIRAPEPAATSVEARQGLVQEMREGLRVVFVHPGLRALMASSVTLSFFGNMVGAVYMLYALRELSLGPVLVGILVALGGVGAFGGAFLAERAARRLGVGPSICGGLLLCGLAYFFLPLAGWAPAPFVVVGLLAAHQIIGDGGRTIYGINMISLRQAITPDEVLGRANASMHVMEEGIGPLGVLVGAGIASVFGLKLTIIIAGCGVLSGALWLLRSASWEPQPSLAPVADVDVSRQ